MEESHNAAYGFRWSGITSSALCLCGAEDWPQLSVRQTAVLDDDVTALDSDSASIQMPKACLRLHRDASTLEIASRLPVDASDVVHPMLWPAASVFARWQERETLHAGAFSLDGETAWGVLGERGAGKSSLLSAVALRGVEVLTDDLLVLEDNRCFAGPRCLDLRPEGAAALGLNQETSPVRSSQRRRLALEPCSGTYRLGGFVSLAWGDSVDLSPLSPAERFGLLVDHRRVAGLGTDFPYLLELAGLPALRFTRPRAWPRLETALAELIEAVEQERRPMGVSS